MKGLKLLLIVCLGFIGIHGAIADDDADMARAATRRTATTTVTTSRGTNGNTGTTARENSASGISRTTASVPSGATVHERSGTSGRGNVVVRDAATRTTSGTVNQSVTARTTSNVMPRATTGTAAVSSSARGGGTVSRATSSRAPVRGTSVARTSTSTSNVSRAATAARGGVAPTAAPTAARRAGGTSAGARVSRAGVTASDIMNRDYTTCRSVFYDCMDEFCANKDSQLKRCACSARANDFDDIRQQLSAAEDKLLDFSQRLLTISMDKEDAEALYQATEGELAFNQEDTSASKQLLDEIANKLNTTFDTSNFDANLAPISLSLNTDAAFDSLDSLSGTSTTAKSGTALYTAALPVCREMAMEVCTSDELAIAESGYQMLIEQDCNTVARAYETQQNQAREQIRESSALLDMSRLNNYQTRNSDDILTCKRKMLDLLTSTSVCGENMEKCLDISGQYIDPSTGDAILTPNLVNLGSLITRPTGNQTWTSVPGNDKFVSYLNSKKLFLESATENCEDIADTVWDQFIDDALAQIKLAQDAKLEEVRQSCTTLTAQCLSDAAESLEDFDARALSIFGVAADKTVKQMCAQVQSACTALLDTIDAGTDWSSGMTEIANDKTYDTIIQTCREVGRNCIIQSCKSISGNFGLCEDIQTSVNRKSIINRTACWDEVLDCVASAGDDTIDQITAQLVADGIIDDAGTFYDNIYGITEYSYPKDRTSEQITTLSNQTLVTTGPNAIANICVTADEAMSKNCIYDICFDVCGNPNSVDENGQPNNPKKDSSECHRCRIAESIWGNCETHPTASLQATDSHNKIKTPKSGQSDTLLSWFAKNTNTQENVDNCRDTSCGPGFVARWDEVTQSTICTSLSNLADDGLYCPVSDGYTQITITGQKDTEFTNCCVASDNQTPIQTSSTTGCCLSKISPISDMTPTQGQDAQQLFNGFGCPLYKDSNLCVPDDGQAIIPVACRSSFAINAGDIVIDPDNINTGGIVIDPGNINTGGIVIDPGNVNVATKLLTDVILCIGGTIEVDEKEIKCKDGRFVLMSAAGRKTFGYTQPRYETPNYMTTNVQYEPYPTQFYRARNSSSAEENICKQNADGTWPTDGGCITESPTSWLIKY